MNEPAKRELAKREFEELVALVREEPHIELVDVDPELEQLIRWEALSLEQQADELNRGEAMKEGDTLWVVAGGMVVAKGSVVHRELVKQERRERLTLRRFSLAGITRPLRVRSRGRSRRSRRAMLRRTPARAPARPRPRRSRHAERTAE